MRIEIEIPETNVKHALVSAYQGGSYGVRAWARVSEVSRDSMSATIEPTDQNGKIYRLTATNVRMVGLPILAKLAPHAFAAILADKSDASHGALLIQCAIFGEVVYA